MAGVESDIWRKKIDFASPFSPFYIFLKDAYVKNFTYPIKRSCF